MTHIYSSKRTVALFMTLMAVMTIAAAPRSVEQARQEAAQLMKKHTSQKVNGKNGATASGPKLVFTKAKKNTQADEVAYYVFSSGNNLGYTIVSGDDRLPAIVGYTESGDYDTELLPDNLKSFMQAYQEFAETATDEQIAEIKAWKANSSNTHAAVAPFMEETWNQTAPYNNLCPEYKYYGASGTVQSNQAVTGCVATAIAQILHYHKCPSELQADIPGYTIEISVNNYLNTIQMPAISAGKSYDWKNMLNEYKGNESTTQNDAVAKLMLHAGCAVQMSYGPSSGASAYAETFSTYFGMNKDVIRKIRREDFNIEEWDNMLYNEIAEGRPVYYEGQSTGGGHAFVLHGYDGEGKYYVNWGWGGYCDGYFDVTILNPNSTSGAGASSSKDGYSYDNFMIIGIQPNITGDNIQYPVFASNWGNKYISDLSINGNTIQFKATVMVANINAQEYTRYIGLGYKDGDNIVPLQTTEEVTIEAASGITYHSKGFETYFSFDAESGKTYELFIIESTDKQTWIASNGSNKTVTLKVTDNEVSIIDQNIMGTASLEDNIIGYVNQNNTINITINNNSEKEYYGPIYIYIDNSEEQPKGYTYGQGITSVAGSNTTFSFTYYPQKGAGTYKFWIIDKNGNEIGKSDITFHGTEYTRTENITSGNWNTICLPFNCNVPNDVTVEEFSEINGDKVIFTSVTQMTAGTAYIFKANGNDVNFTSENGKTENINDIEKTEGTFIGVLSKTITFNDDFREEGYTYYGINPTDNEFQRLGTAATCTPYHAYLKVKDETAQAQALKVIHGGGDGTTGISNITDNEKPQVIYNINGQRITTPQKGINIINGRKVIIK